VIVPDEALPILRAIAPAFARPTFRRSALLGNGRRTVADLLRVAAPLAAGHVTSYRGRPTGRYPCPSRPWRS